MCVPGSNKAHEEIMRNSERKNSKMTGKNLQTKKKRMKSSKKHSNPVVRLGDLILWDSRTFHCNTTPTSRNPRACAYICMIPKNKISEKVRARRKKAWDDRRCTSHYPGEGFRFFPVVPRFSDEGMKAVLPEIAIEELTDLQRILLCIDIVLGMFCLGIIWYVCYVL